MLYFFDLVAGTTMLDPSGTDAKDDDAAQREAVARAKAYKGAGFRAVAVRDKQGHLVCRVLIEH